MFKILIIFFILSLATIACAQNKTIDKKTNIQSKVEEKFKVTKTEEEWKKILSPEAYYILREHGTERAFTGKYHAHHEKGIYYCAACDLPLFKSETKFDSGTGWPSFYKPIENGVGTSVDKSFFTVRTEVHCARCGGHLGHVFDDGPKPTGLRYCINSASLSFKK